MEGSHSVTIGQNFISSQTIKCEGKNISDLWELR